ncbi:MAG: cytochrome C [Pseudomonadota bacterium]
MTIAKIALALAGLLAAGGAAAQSAGITLPSGAVPPELSGQDNAVVVANCSACHSLDYIVTQPRGKGEQFWRDSVTKMITVYGAPLSPETAQQVVTVLASKFG